MFSYLRTSHLISENLNDWDYQAIGAIMRLNLFLIFPNFLPLTQHSVRGIKACNVDAGAKQMQMPSDSYITK